MKEQASRISIILVFYNASILNLEAAIKSVLAQDYSCWELFLVDDGSTDRSTDLAHNYALLYPQNIFYLTHPGQVNLGTSASYNLGIETATGNYLAFLSANQTWLPNKLSYQLEILTKNPSLKVVFGLSQCDRLDLRRRNQQQKIVENYKLESYLDRVNQPADLAILLLLARNQPFSLSHILLHRGLLQDIGCFDPRLNTVYALKFFLLQICFNAPVFLHQKCLIRYTDCSLSSATTTFRECDRYPHSESLAIRVYQFWLEKYLKSQIAFGDRSAQLLHRQLFPQEYSWLHRSYRYLSTIYARINKKR